MTQGLSQPNENAPPASSQQATLIDMEEGDDDDSAVSSEAEFEDVLFGPERHLSTIPELQHVQRTQLTPAARVDESTNDQVEPTHLTTNGDVRPSPQQPVIDPEKEINPLSGEIACETVLRLSNEFAPIVEKDADTLLYIGPPPQAADQLDEEYEHIEAHFYRPYLMRSETLKKTGSAQFAKFLGPMSARVERKLKKLAIHKRIKAPESIKYFIDLRPMLDDDEALLMLTELTSTTEVLDWHSTSKKYDIPPEQVCGRDNLNVPERRRYSCKVDSEVQEEPPQTAVLVEPELIRRELQREQQKATQTDLQRYKEKISALRKQPREADYSPLRHHIAIERLLHAIAGHDPKLNSAPKVWTYFAIARYFDCATNPRVNTWITSWLLTSNNNNFIQNNPEVVYRMATGMQSLNMVRCSFAMLVGEKALLRMRYPHFAHQARQSIHGRLLSILDDDDLNRIDHAAPSLIRSVKDLFDRLLDPQIAWATAASDTENSKLDRIEVVQEEDSVIISQARSRLYNYLRRIIFQVLWRRPTSNLHLESSRFLDKCTTYESLPLACRIFTQTFWMQLKNEAFFHDNDPDGHDMAKIWPRMLSDLQAASVISEIDDIEFVSKWDLFEAFSNLNKMLAARYGLYLTDRDCRLLTDKTSNQVPSVDQMDEYGRVMRPRALGGQTDEALGHSGSSNARSGTSYDTAHHRHQEKMRAGVDTATNTSRTIDNWPISTQVEESVHPGEELDLSVDYTDDADDWTTLTAPFDVEDDSPQASQTNGMENRDASTQYEPVNDTLPFSVQSISLFGNTYKDNTERDSGSSLMEEDEIFTLSLDNQTTLPIRPAAFAQPSNAEAAQSTLADVDSNINLLAGHSTGAEWRPSEHTLHSRFDYSSSSWKTPDIAQASTHAAEPTNPFSGVFPPQTESGSRIQNIFTETEREKRRRGKQSLSHQQHEQKRQRKQVEFDDTVQSRYSKPNESLGNFFHNDRTREELGLISTPTLLSDLTVDLRAMLEQTVLTPGYVVDGTCDLDISTNEIDTLLNLTEDQWKYLPLWAGGFDDGSGGVFASDDLGGGDLPDALDVGEGGFRGGPTAGLFSSGVPTEIGESMSMMDVSDLDDDEDHFERVMTDEGVSTVGKASRIATDGTRGGASTVISLDD